MLGGEGGEIFLKHLEDGESSCLCEEPGKNHCKGKQSVGRIWGWRRGWSGGWSEAEAGPDGVWGNVCCGPRLHAPLVLPSSLCCPHGCSPLDDESWQREAVRPAYSDTGRPSPPLSCGDCTVWSCPALLCLTAGCAAPPSYPQ